MLSQKQCLFFIFIMFTVDERRQMFCLRFQAARAGGLSALRPPAVRRIAMLCSRRVGYVESNEYVSNRYIIVSHMILTYLQLFNHHFSQARCPDMHASAVAMPACFYWFAIRASCWFRTAWRWSHSHRIWMRAVKKILVSHSSTFSCCFGFTVLSIQIFCVQSGLRRGRPLYLHAERWRRLQQLFADQLVAQEICRRRNHLYAHEVYPRNIF